MRFFFFFSPFALDLVRMGQQAWKVIQRLLRPPVTTNWVAKRKAKSGIKANRYSRAGTGQQHFTHLVHLFLDEQNRRMHAMVSCVYIYLFRSFNPSIYMTPAFLSKPQLLIHLLHAVYRVLHVFSQANRPSHVQELSDQARRNRPVSKEKNKLDMSYRFRV